MDRHQVKNVKELAAEQSSCDPGPVFPRPQATGHVTQAVAYRRQHTRDWSAGEKAPSPPTYLPEVAVLFLGREAFPG